MFLTQGLFWGCGRGVSQGYTRLKAYLAWKMFLSSFSWLLAGSLSSWPFSVCSQGSPQHVSWSDSLSREWFQRPKARDTILLLWSHLQVTHYHPAFFFSSEVNQKAQLTHNRGGLYKSVNSRGQRMTGATVEAGYHSDWRNGHVMFIFNLLPT